MNVAAGFGRVLPFPFRHSKEVGFGFQQPLKDQRKTLGGWFFQGEYLDVVVVHPQERPVTFEMGFRQVKVEEAVVFQSGQIELLPIKVQDALEYPESFRLLEQSNRKEVIHLQKKARNLLIERSLCSAKLFIHQQDFTSCGQQCA